MTKVLMLAAGIGTRLRPVTDLRPKCLFEFGDSTLLERNLKILSDYGIEEVCLAVGHLKDMIRKTVRSKYAGVEIKYIDNDEYDKTGSAYSLWLARDELVNGAIIMDSDILFDNRIFGKIANSRYSDCLLVDSQLADTGEEVKVIAQQGIVRDLGKKVTDYTNCIGEAVGIMKFSAKGMKILIEELGKFIDGGRLTAEYEDAIQNMVRKCNVYFIDTEGLAWIEIDFPQDLDRAINEVYPQILKGESE